MRWVSLYKGQAHASIKSREGLNQVKIIYRCYSALLHPLLQGPRPIKSWISPLIRGICNWWEWRHQALLCKTFKLTNIRINLRWDQVNRLLISEGNRITKLSSKLKLKWDQCFRRQRWIFTNWKRDFISIMSSDLLVRMLPLSKAYNIVTLQKVSGTSCNSRVPHHLREG